MPMSDEFVTKQAAGIDKSIGHLLGGIRFKARVRHGCDGCKNKVPTQHFAGFCGDTLWICDACVERMTNWKDGGS